MKSHKVEEQDQWAGMHSADPPDRIENAALALLKNGFCDATGRIIKSYGVIATTSAESLGLTAADLQTGIRSLHTFEGQVGENPSSRELCIVGPKLMRSRENNLAAHWQEITFTDDLDTPGLDRPAAGVFRNAYFYHQNGIDPPFRIKCEEDDPSATLTTTAEWLGLRPPAFCFWGAGAGTVGSARRFPPLVDTSYAVTFVYGDRGESGPSIVLTMQLAVGTYDSLPFDNVPIGPTGCTARRIYRSFIGRGQKATTGGLGLINSIEHGASCEMFLLVEIPDNVTTTFTDSYDDASLRLTQRLPQPRPFPPIAQYQLMHLDHIFWAKTREHPWVLGVMADTTRSGFTNYRVTISNSGAGTITFQKYNAGWTNDVVISNYKTLTLRTIMTYLLGSGTTGIGGAALDYTASTMAITAAGIDLDRTYTFKAVTQREIWDRDDVYWFVAIDDDLTQGLEWHPNRVQWSDIAFPEQVSAFNGTDLTRFGSKRITNMFLMDNTPVVTTDTDSWMMPGSFVPDNLGVPSFEVHRSQAMHGSICTRPDAIASIPQEGIVMLAHDGLRRFRGESSSLAGLVIRDWFKRVLEHPVCRDQLVMVYYKGELFIALPTFDIGSAAPH